MTNQKEVAPLVVGQKNAIDILAQDENYLAHKNDYVFEKSDFHKRINDWVLKGVIERYAISVIYAPSKQGKSIFVQRLLCYNLPLRPDLLFLYADNDNSNTTATDRGFNDMVEKYPNFEYMGKSKISRAKVSVIDWMLTFNDETLSISVLIIDSLRNFIKGDLKDPKAVKEFTEKLELLREKGVTIIILHHSTKTDAKTFSGAEDIRASADNMISLENILKMKNIQKDYKDEFYFKITLEHSRNHNECDKTFYINTIKNEFRECDLKEVSRIILPEICIRAREILENNENDVSQSNLYKELECVNNNNKRKQIEQGLGILYDRYSTGVNNAYNYTKHLLQNY